MGQFIFGLSYVSFTYPYMCCFFSLFIHMLLIRVWNLLFMFHTKMPWWVLFKVFQKYRLPKSTCHKLFSCKVFKSLCWNRFYCIQQVNMSCVIYDFSHMFICLLWFYHGLPNGEIVKTFVVHLLGTYVTILCNWLILWQNTFYLYLGRFRMCLIFQETIFQDQVLKTCKFIQYSS